MAALCRRFGISRTCGHKWWRRFKRDGGPGLRDVGRRPQRADQISRCWLASVLRVRRKYGWGARKTRVLLAARRDGQSRPSVRTITRWLTASGAVKKQAPRRAQRALWPGLQRLLGRCANDVWTIDFKGWYVLRDGTRVYPLTVRDLASRYVLYVGHVRPHERAVGRVLRQLFKRYGVPREMWCDNGPPFGSTGPRGWTTLSLQWVKLGIHVAFGRPARPGDNAAHEQMHQVLKTEATRPTCANLAAQQRRFKWWRQRYNQIRPHESLQMQTPAGRYRVRKKRPLVIVPWQYPPAYESVRLDSRGRYTWSGKPRWIGRAFAFERIGLRRVDEDLRQVYIGPHLLGTLHRTGSEYLRPV
jgi:putative transposase